MGVRSVFAASIALAVLANSAKAEEYTHDRFRATMNSVFGSGNWRVTGGYRTQARENELRAQGALTVRPGAISRHSIGTPDSPGAYDVVVDGLSPYTAALKLRRAGAPFRTIFAEGAHGSQGPHLHVDPYSGVLKGFATSFRGLEWKVANPTPAQLAVALLRRQADQGDVDAQLELGQIYASGRIERKSLVEAYVWTALAASNSAAPPQTRQAAEQALGAIARSMSPDEILDARQFLQDPSGRDGDSRDCLRSDAEQNGRGSLMLIGLQDAEAPLHSNEASSSCGRTSTVQTFGPVIARRRDAEGVRVVQPTATPIMVASPIVSGCSAQMARSRAASACNSRDNNVSPGTQ